MSERIYNVLLLCSANSARSILAGSILRKDGAGLREIGRIPGATASTPKAS